MHDLVRRVIAGLFAAILAVALTVALPAAATAAPVVHQGPGCGSASLSV